MIPIFFSGTRIEKDLRSLQYVADRIDRVLQQIGDKARGSKEDVAEIFIRTRIRKQHDRWESELTMLCDGDVTEINQIKKGTIQDYVNKLEYFILKHKRNRFD